jgi:hypothetical protein
MTNDESSGCVRPEKEDTQHLDCYMMMMMMMMMMLMMMMIPVAQASSRRLVGL